MEINLDRIANRMIETGFDGDVNNNWSGCLLDALEYIYDFETEVNKKVKEKLGEA